MSKCKYRKIRNAIVQRAWGNPAIPVILSQHRVAVWKLPRAPFAFLKPPTNFDITRPNSLVSIVETSLYHGVKLHCSARQPIRARYDGCIPLAMISDGKSALLSSSTEADCCFAPFPPKISPIRERTIIIIFPILPKAPIALRRVGGAYI
ncbi:hypothetical protein K469DRAFT_62125 [Zopfia rhizophila CBS 207.26]|uniref:Uncharacterized protein n=1 Tax=Zopfia rhizophila CBS 207.26 TaxID=1314779 RepID=A0A6A6EFD0_9PEZI|nr:hypothetical protein K469DRAFT_62125 [Zopfia rhizophila CBS 207.26]